MGPHTDYLSCNKTQAHSVVNIDYSWASFGHIIQGGGSGGKSKQEIITKTLFQWYMWYTRYP